MIFGLREEDAVPFASQHGNQIRFSVWRRVRVEPEARLLGRPANRGASAQKISFELLRRVFDLRCVQGAIPFHVEGNLRADRKHSRNRWSGKPQPLRQRVGKVVVVEDIQPTHDQAGPRAVEIYFHGTVPYGNHPENVVSIDMDVVIMNLFGECGRSNRTGVEVKSNKGERALMLLTIRSNESALTETHVGLERQPHGCARRGVPSGPAAADVG